MSKLCVLNNFAPIYREAIFKAIDSRWDTDWFFGFSETDIKELDFSVLKNAVSLPNVFLKGGWYWQKGALRLASRNYSTYLLLGDPRCLSTWLIAMRLRIFARSKRLYFWSHGWYGKEGWATKLIKKIFFNLADGIFLYGNHARRLMVAEGFDESRLFVIHNSLDHDKQLRIRKSVSTTDIYNDIYRERFGNELPVLIFIGRLTKVKKLDMLLAAVARLHQMDVPVNLVFVGEGEESDRLKKLAGKLQLKDYCWFYGACYDENINAGLIYNADLCVAPGNVGLTAMHSMVYGTPVVSHDDFKWQMPEFEAIVPGVTGGFFVKDDAESLAGVIATWLAAHSDRERVRRDCYDEIDNRWTPDFQMSVLEKNLKE